MKKGDIVLTPFPYTNLRGSKNRPALVLIEDESDITVAFITTKVEWREISDILLLPNSQNGFEA